MKFLITLSVFLLPFICLAQKDDKKKSDDKFMLDDKTTELYTSASEKIQKENFKGAAEDLNKLLETNPSLYFVRYNLAHSFYELGDLKAAQEQYLLLLEFEPNNQDVIFNLSNINVLLKDFDNAFKLLDASLKLDEKNINIYLNKGLIFYNIGKVEEAVQNFKIASELGSKEANGLLKLLGGKN